MAKTDGHGIVRVSRRRRRRAWRTHLVTRFFCASCFSGPSGPRGTSLKSLEQATGLRHPRDLGVSVGTHFSPKPSRKTLCGGLRGPPTALAASLFTPPSKSVARGRGRPEPFGDGYALRPCDDGHTGTVTGTLRWCPGHGVTVRTQGLASSARVGAGRRRWAGPATPVLLAGWARAAAGLGSVPGPLAAMENLVRSRALPLGNCLSSLINLPSKNTAERAV